MEINYVKGKPYFCDMPDKILQYKYLASDIECDVVIVGGGINGAICAYQLSLAGINTVLIDKARLACLNTSCATALLEYQLDEHAKDLFSITGRANVIRSYNYGLRSLDMIDSFIAKHGNKCEYARQDALIYTLKQSEATEIAEEYSFRKDNDYNVELYTSENNPFPFPLKAGIYSVDGGGNLNPYLFAKQLIEQAVENGARVYENTEAHKINYDSNGVTVECDYGITVKAKKVICATGYNTHLFTKRKLCDKYVSYSITTSPIENFGWHKSALLQDNSDPYHYLKITKDNRIVLGGEDTKFWFDNICLATAERKYEKLTKYLYRLFPDLKGKVAIDYKFCGAFSATMDNLGIIGESKEQSNLWYCLGYGANGIIYAMQGGKMLADLFYGKYSPDLDLFSPDRKLS